MDFTFPFLVLFIGLSAVLAGSLRPTPPSLCLSTKQATCSKTKPCTRRSYTCMNGRCCIGLIGPIRPPRLCPSGIIVGPSCSKGRPCKSGYSCLGGGCCRDRACPRGHIQGGACNLFPRKQRCKPGYNCVGNVCCRPPIIVPSRCPSGVVGPTCSRSKPCKPGYSCLKGRCCRDTINVCPKGHIAGGTCNTRPGQRRCLPGYICMKNVCCKPQIISVCPSGITGPTCSKSRPCKPGYSCLLGTCCRDPVCPRGHQEGGSCNLSPGMPRCKPGYNCVNNFCCRPPIISTCPFGQAGPSCSSRKPCKRGYNCILGKCCRDLDQGCPSGMSSAGKCLRPQVSQPQCSRGYTCINGNCCSRFILPIDQCPRLRPQLVVFCPPEPADKRLYHRCEIDSDCRSGQLCCRDKCQRRYCHTVGPKKIRATA